MVRIVLVLAAVLIVAFLPLYERKLNGFIEELKARAAVSSVPSAETGDEEDILSNKNKWRMLIIGYCIFFLFMIFATVSIVTLNSKLNNISAATGDILDRLSVLESND